MTVNKTKVTAGISIILTSIALVAAWITHVVVAIQYLLESGADQIGYLIFLAIGAFMPPVGIIHGIGVWFGAW